MKNKNYKYLNIFSSVFFFHKFNIESKIRLHLKITPKCFHNSSPLEIVGYALCFNSYSTWQGRSIFLEDLYVKPSYRKQGVGKLLFTAVAKHAKETNCQRFDLHVLDWNPARNFYDKMGGINLTEKEGWHFTRFDRKAIETLADDGNK